MPLPLHLMPPLWLHAVPAGSGGFDGMPALHRFCVQALVSTGRSLSSLTVCDWPAPSHWTFLQSPVGLVLGGSSVPARDVGDDALVVGAGERPAGGVGAAVGGGEAADAGALAVAHLVGSTGRPGGQVRVRGHAGRADVVRAHVAVGGHVGVVVHDHGLPGAVALASLAVARHLQGQRGAGGSEADAAGAVGAGARVAVGVRARAARRRQAGDAGALAVADRAPAAAVAGGHERVARPFPRCRRRSCTALPSTGRSRSSLTGPDVPWPLQTFFLQSRGVCAAASVPAAMLVTPHWPVTQLRVWQSASVPGQVDADRHSTQLFAPSHTRLPPQPVPDWTGRWDGVPELHSSVVQTLPSTGRSALSLKTCELPAPSHCSPLQSPAVGSTSLVFAGGEVESADAGRGAGSRAAGGVGARAVRGDRAADALAVRVAVVGAAAVGVRRHHRVRRRCPSCRCRWCTGCGPRARRCRRWRSRRCRRPRTGGACSRPWPAPSGPCPRPRACCRRRRRCRCGARTRTRCPDNRRRRCRRRRSCPPCTRTVQSALTRHGLPGPHFPQWPPQSMPVSSLFLMPSVQVGAPPSLPPASGPPSTPPPVPPRAPAVPPVPPVPPTPPVLPPLPPRCRPCRRVPPVPLMSALTSLAASARSADAFPSLLLSPEPSRASAPLDGRRRNPRPRSERNHQASTPDTNASNPRGKVLRDAPN